MADDGRAACSLPDASLTRSGAVSAARSRSIGHLNLSQPLGSSAARAEVALSESAARTARTRMSRLIVGHARGAGVLSVSLESGMRVPGMPPAYGTAASHPTAFQPGEPTIQP